MGKYGKVWESMGKKVWESMEKYGKVWEIKYLGVKTPEKKSDEKKL